MNQTVIAIDPGASGGIACWKNDAITLYSMPQTEGDVCQLLRDLSDGQSTFVVIELVGGFIKGNPSPGSAMFSFGMGFGVLIGCCMALELPLQRVRPQVWQKAVKFSSGAVGNERKKLLKAEAQRRYPQLLKQITLKTCDALLMLEYARKEAGV